MWSLTIKGETFGSCCFNFIKEKGNPPTNLFSPLGKKKTQMKMPCVVSWTVPKPHQTQAKVQRFQQCSCIRTEANTPFISLSEDPISDEHPWLLKKTKMCFTCPGLLVKSLLVIRCHLPPKTNHCWTHHLWGNHSEVSFYFPLRHSTWHMLLIRIAFVLRVQI